MLYPLSICSWNKFSDICNQCLKLIPSKWSSNKRNQPWITSHIKQITRKKQRAYNRARLTNYTKDWSAYLDLKRLSQRECRTAFNKYVSNFIDDNNNITKKLWSFVDHLNIRAQQSLIHCLKQMLSLTISLQFILVRIPLMFQF